MAASLSMVAGDSGRFAPSHRDTSLSSTPSNVASSTWVSLARSRNSRMRFVIFQSPRQLRPSSCEVPTYYNCFRDTVGRFLSLYTDEGLEVRPGGRAFRRFTNCGRSPDTIRERYSHSKHQDEAEVWPRPSSGPFPLQNV